MDKFENQNLKRQRNTSKNIDWDKILVISPESIFFQIFNTLTILLSLSSSMIYGHFAAHRKDIESEMIENDKLFDRIELSIEILFFLEMISMFFKEYQPKDSVYPVKNIE
jgi:hypothetical protein